MTLAFRNLEADPAQPVESWPFEGIVTAIERGSVTDLARVSRAIRRDPWGPVARQVEDALAIVSAPGVAPLMLRAIDRARRDADASERAVVAERVRDAIAASGLTAADFARRIGTSPSRLSTYRTGRVTPSAALLLRMERVASRGRP